MIRRTDGSFDGLREPKEFVDVVLSQMPDPFHNIEGPGRLVVAKKIGQLAEKQFRKGMARLEKLVRKCEPAQTLAHFEAYDCTFYDGKEGDDYIPIEQFGIELLQAMFLSFPEGTFPAEEPEPKILLAINKTLRELGPSYSMRGLARERAGDERTKKADLLSHQVQMHTFAMRNAGFQDQVVAQLIGVFGRLDSDYQARTGVKLSGLVTMWTRLVKVVEKRFNERFQRLRAAMSAETPEDAIERYCNARGFDSGYADSMISELRRYKGDADMARRYCMQDSDRTAFHHYLFTTDDFVGAYPEVVDPASLRRVVERWAFRPGGLVGANREHFFLSNPVWERPIIHLRPDQFFWPVIQIFHSFGLEMLERLVAEFPELKDRYENRARPEFLEQRVADEFARALPGAEVLRGVKWTDPTSGRQYETDLLVLIDSTAVVVESKSGRITQAARRGAPDRLRKEIRKLIEEAAQQSSRFVKTLQETKGAMTLRLRDGGVRKLEARSLRRCIRLNVTLDFFGPLACEVRSMQEAGLLDPAIGGAPTMALVDLENLVVLLDSPAQVLHYLARRGELEQTLAFFADELDLLALYLGTAFGLGDFEFQTEQHVSFYGLSDQIEPFLFAKSASVEVIKPRLKLTPFWQSLLARFEKRRFRNWTLASSALLNVGYEGQQDFEKQQEEMCERIRSTRPTGGEINTIIAVNGNSRRRSCLVAVGVRDVSDAERLATLQHAVQSAMEESQCEEVLFLCHSVNHRSGPYFTAGLRLPDLIVTT